MFKTKSEIAIALFLARSATNGSLPDMSIGGITQTTKLSRPTVNLALAAFSSLGYVTLVRRPDDSRYKQVRLTEVFWRQLKKQFDISESRDLNLASDTPPGFNG